MTKYSMMFKKSQEGSFAFTYDEKVIRSSGLATDMVDCRLSGRLFWYQIADSQPDMQSHMHGENKI
eukprot:scaffold113222_cov40-Cyclotella_meneghiniana.AAC.1